MQRIQRWCLMSLLLSLILVGSSSQTVLFADEVQFNRDIRPIFSNTCFKCHGPDAKTREADLRLDERDSAIADRGGYAAIVPRASSASEIVRRIESQDPDLMMPPPTSGLSLTDAEKARVRRWVAEGAVYQQHWSFEPTHRTVPPMDVNAATAIDAFINAKLLGSGLTALGPVDPTTQLRRVSLDLTGLPPTIPQTDQFLRMVERQGIDQAYRAVVDQLLQSPRFGEQMAWHWMEAARYADTDGYQNDGPREMWRWRDWVIDAFNRNLPFDQFTIEQLAGDLLPNATDQQRIATAFNRNHRYNSEEGIPIDEFLLENAVDRVDTTATVWMGLTVGCARCHDHKYDPISQREYYQLIDFFNDVAESGRAIKNGNSEPWIKSPTDAQQAQFEKLTQRVANKSAALQFAEAEIATGQRVWEQSITEAGYFSGVPLISNGLDHFFSFDQADDRVTIAQGRPNLDAGRFGLAASVGGQDQFLLGKIPGLIGNGRFSISFWMSPQDVQAGAVLSNETAGTTRDGILVEFIDGRLRWNINHRWISGVSTIETVQPFKPGTWTQVTLTNDGTQRAQGMTIYLDGVKQAVNVIRNTNSNVAKRDQGAALSLGYSKHVGFWQGRLDELRFYTSRTLSVDEAQLLAVPESVAEVVTVPVNARSDFQHRLLRVAFLENSTSPHLRSLWTELQDAIAAQTAAWDKLPTTMVMEDLPGGRPSHLRLRGQYDQWGEATPAGVPQVLPNLSGPADRLAFAKWLVDGRHPLTARVIVNRYWQMLIGTGLVKTAEDFGSQGDLPTHPDLLDWLATRFMDQGWDIKAIIKKMVLSDAYRRSSHVEPSHQIHDPHNLFYARAARLRLPGNVLRDQALFVSGSLVEKLGGISVFPFQPAGLWEEASNATYRVGKGEDLSRRSLYTYWKRTLSPPNLSLLDNTDRESCAVKPRKTNTPLQALTLLNDVIFAESARNLAERMLDSGRSDQARLSFAFRSLTSRRPSFAELELLVSALQSYREEFQQHPDSAMMVCRIARSGAAERYSPVDVAAATAVANLLLNLDEVTTRE